MSDLDQTIDNNDELAAAALEALRARADQLGIKYHPSLSAEKLSERIAKHLEGSETAADAPVALEKSSLTPGQKIKKMKDEATKLIRVNITCMNPNKREWDGEIFAVGNANLPTIKKFVPFNTVDGYHIPKIMYDMLKARECQVFFTERQKNGVNMRKGKLIKEFAIEVLPQLTEKELADLAKVQAAAGVIEA